MFLSVTSSCGEDAIVNLTAARAGRSDRAWRRIDEGNRMTPVSPIGEAMKRAFPHSLVGTTSRSPRTRASQEI